MRAHHGTPHFQARLDEGGHMLHFQAPAMMRTPPKKYKHISNHLNMFWKAGYRGPIFWGERICEVPGLGVLVMQLYLELQRTPKT
jgi:hypothetical protein